MKIINKCLNEWNAIIEALGQGKQSILIRYYKTYIKEFLLYPTFYYSTSDDYLDSFQRKHHSFVEKNALPRKEYKKAEIKYYARLEKISEKSSLRIGTLQNLYVWTPEHVKSYLKGRTAYIWALRVYKLPEPFMANTSQRAIRFANLKEDISLEGIEPVLSDAKFQNMLKAVQ